jgi:flagellar hook protein FlgE
MGIFGAMVTAVSGLRAESYALEHISDNIANTRTVGFKRTETAFSDLVINGLPGSIRGGGVRGVSRSTNLVQGDIQSSEINTHMGIRGDGYFITEERISEADGEPVFKNVARYTRRGDFAVDRHGYLVNGAGYYLKGLKIDPTTGNPSGSLPEVIKVSTNFLPARASTTITYHANLAATPKTADYSSSVANSELLDPDDFTNNPLDAGTGKVLGSEEEKFLNASISGGAITLYDSTGAPVNVQLRWAKTNSVANGGTDTWEAFYQSKTNAGVGDAAWTNLGQVYTFSSNGQLATPASGDVTISSLTVNDVNLGDIKLTHGSTNLTQFADSNGISKVTDIFQDGYASGEMSSIAISNEGRIVGTSPNGQNLELYEVSLASFNSDEALEKLNGGAFAETRNSGAAIVGAQGSIVAQALEGSNADIADEFTKLIVTQQAYAASTRIVTTGDDMLKEALAMKR